MVRGQATTKPPLPLEGMNPQATQPYAQCLPYNLADWDYGIDNTERWYAKTALDWLGIMRLASCNPRTITTGCPPSWWPQCGLTWWRSSPIFRHPAPLMMAANYSKHAKSTENALCIIHGGDYSVVNSVSSVHTVCNCRRQLHTNHNIARIIIGMDNRYQGEMHNRTPGFHQTAKPSTT